MVGALPAISTSSRSRSADFTSLPGVKVSCGDDASEKSVYLLVKVFQGAVLRNYSRISAGLVLCPMMQKRAGPNHIVPFVHLSFRIFMVDPVPGYLVQLCTGHYLFTSDLLLCIGLITPGIKPCLDSQALVTGAVDIAKHMFDVNKRPSSPVSRDF